MFALATVSGPLIGGVVVDSPLGWRGTFFIGLPVAVVAFAVLQAKLHLPVVKRQVRIDYLGATLLVAGVSILLVWVSLAGNQFAWASLETALLVPLGVLVLGAAIYVENRVAADPVIPMRLFRDRTTALATTACVLVGLSMFGATVYLSQYFQSARGMSPTEAGLMSVCMVGGLLVSSIVSGRVISATGLWKRWLVAGMVLVVAGMALLGTIDETTSLVWIGVFMAVLGLGLGATMQNLILAVQNNVSQADLGAASSVVAFFRSIGGSVGVSVLGALLAHQVSTKVMAGLSDLGIDGSHQTGAIPDLDALPAPVRALYETAFGEATGHVFLAAVPFAIACPRVRAADQGGPPADHPRARRGPGRGRRMSQSRDEQLRRPRGRGRRADPAHPPGHPRAGPRGPRGHAAHVVPAARLADRRGPGARLGDRGELRDRQGRHLAARSSTSSTSAWSPATPDPADGRATLVEASADAVRRMADVADAPAQVARRAAGRLVGRRARRRSSTPSAATTTRSTQLTFTIEPDGGVRRQPAVGRARRSRSRPRRRGARPPPRPR